MTNWRLHVLNHLHQYMTPYILEHIESHRNEAIVDTSILKRVLDTFLVAGIEFETGKCLEPYKTYFEDPFIQATKEYYSARVPASVVPNYLEWVEERLKDERDRSNLYLHKSTFEPVSTYTLYQ